MYEAIFMHHVWGCYAIQVSWLFLQCWNRLRFSPLNTWWSSWLAFQGHVVQKKKKCKLKHLNHTRIVRCSYHESNSGTETKERNMRFPSPFSHSPGAYALAGRGTDAPTLFTFFLSFSSWHSKWNWVWVWTLHVLRRCGISKHNVSSEGQHKWMGA